MANIKLKELLFEIEDFTAKSKETGKLVHFKSKDAYQAALKAGTHENPKNNKGGSSKAGKSNDMFGGDYAKDRGGRTSTTNTSVKDEFPTEMETLEKYVRPGGERNTNIDDAVETLFKNKSKYPKELTAKPGEVYRGTIASGEELKKMKPVKKEGRWFYYKKPYTSKRKVQSFTYKEDIASKFAMHNALANSRSGGNGIVEAVIVVNVDSNFVVNPKWLFDEIGKNANLKKNEQETFHVGYNIPNALIKVDALQLYGFDWRDY
jgi:hypothetical protein